jgi:hypothetical protein
MMNGKYVAAALLAVCSLIPMSQTHAVVRPLAAAVTVTGIDLHDGMVMQSGSTYYLYGTEYGCGFHWGQTGTPWCGFGVSTASSLAGPWSAPILLFGPSAIDPWTGTTWQAECGDTGAGCFNPRMIVRTWGPADNVPILWFNAPADYSRSRANAYYAMGCNSLTGPCGYVAPNGSVHKPSLTICGGNGDPGFAQVTTTSAPYLLCTNANQTLSEEQVSFWGVDGTGVGVSNLAGLTNVESPGAYFDAGSGLWVLTYSDPNCGYCTGDGTGYATATTLTGPWVAPANMGAAAPVTGRRDLSATSCGGQPRTISVLGGQPFEGIDLWTGFTSEPTAGLHYEPLAFHGNTSSPGQLWQPFDPWPCA